MKTYLLWIIALLSIVSYSQVKCIALTDKNSERVRTVEENERIKIQTVDGKKYLGKFTVVDSASIMIEGSRIPLNSIVKIKRKTTSRIITKTVLITVGSALVILGIGGAVAGGYGVLATVFYTPPGIAILIATISDNHPSKRWEYSIKLKNENSLPSDDVYSLGKSQIEP